MSPDERGPAHVVSLAAGSLTFIGGVVRTVTSGILPARAAQLGLRQFTNLLRANPIGLGPSLVQASTLIGILTGVIILISASVIANPRRQNTIPGTVILIASVVGLLGGGGFLIGSILGIVGGLLAMTTRPAAGTV